MGSVSRTLLPQKMEHVLVIQLLQPRRPSAVGGHAGDSLDRRISRLVRTSWIGDLHSMMDLHHIVSFFNFLPTLKPNSDCLFSPVRILVGFFSWSSILTGIFRNLLKKLKDTDTKASFYVIGSRVIERPNILIEEYMSGHEIGVHTWSHAVQLFPTCHCTFCLTSFWTSPLPV